MNVAQAMTHPNMTFNGRPAGGPDGPEPNRRQRRPWRTEHEVAVRKLKRLYRRGRVHPDIAPKGFRAVMRALADADDHDSPVAQRWLANKGR